ncbi:hypothetical protein MATR_20710 [Marivirga tractuosa]|uniref:Uncharacterized protein n=1 Tax=Marivirga tractuosa (strain ATCC 23168 / DSM 4126 / NBRC 15989 / NCIMB 1408 / VKM B-1430 / H-43) TaxID=643867 RepID=E4TM21_MARTH|nr:hypothetical protein [Marivirga tractuosa]ADR20312.1 hypothetical protein Ftrac_0303 [Marivirga tractuosa DSM 4126]BDD15246.1 hypothetical protein MATR_20710 [Marivirga tractuosa]
MRLYTHPKLRITVEEINNIPYIKEVWRGILNPVVFRELINVSLDIYAKEIKKHKITGQDKFLLFADVTELEMIRQEEITWLDTEINPQYEKLGFTHQAVLSPITLIAANKVDEYNTDDEKAPFVTKVFRDHKKALKWFLDDAIK